MQTTLLGQTDLNVSRLGFGAAPIGFLETPEKQTGRLINLLLDAGVNLFDTAAMYRGAEARLGVALEGHRDHVVLISKCGHAEEELPGGDWSPELIRASIERSLQRLKTDHLDIALIHSCEQSVLDEGEALATLLTLRDEGKLRYAGYSGDNETAANAAALEGVDIIETSINIADQHNIDVVLPACIEHNVGVIAKRPIANAAWNPLNKQRGVYQTYAKTYHDRLKQMAITPMDLGYHGHPEVEWPEIALKFTLALEGVDTAIVGTTSTVNAQANLDAVAKNPMRDQAVQKLRDAFKEAEQKSGEAWVGQT
ncbi:MAG: aldo/keto reductase [Phycisphaerales bacterium JB063]